MSRDMNRTREGKSGSVKAIKPALTKDLGMVLLIRSLYTDHRNPIQWNLNTLSVSVVRKYDYYKARIIKMKTIEICFDPMFIYAIQKLLEGMLN